MQSQPTAGGVPSSGSVSGLGVTDALRLELTPVQVPWLIDELDELRGPFEEELQLKRDRATDHPSASADEALEAASHDLRMLRMMRAQLPPRDHDGLVALVGPTAMVLDVVRGTMRNVVAALSELVHGTALGHVEWHQRVWETTAAAAAWVRTFLDCEAVELFALDVVDEQPPGEDPADSTRTTAGRGR